MAWHCTCAASDNRIGTVLTCSTCSRMTASQLSGALTCAACTDKEPEAEQTGRSTGADQQCQALTQKGVQRERKPYRGSLCGAHMNKDVQLIQARHSADALAVKEADNTQQEAGEETPECAKNIAPAADARDKQASAKSLKAVVRITADETLQPTSHAVLAGNQAEGQPAIQATSCCSGADGQCGAVTLKGTQCSRRATNGGFCWQHAGARVAETQGCQMAEQLGKPGALICCTMFPNFCAGSCHLAQLWLLYHRQDCM